ncbi:hypothetical protein AN189_07255 [Loktanella sp. 3ANDIMAR09]|uniref:hypothetical protein n=1 Tax=Loktanella sp. 3ANDIMAR09 TaxID=1225657 RepID=UPI00070093ED|nr:hypothetical protein [Loktanella sp. 3ANDIMAR09]KQI68696.1 hypothetical protein AN189_07255 [Loktanella sp. 3ANDIMAR09]
MAKSNDTKAAYTVVQGAWILGQWKKADEVAVLTKEQAAPFIAAGAITAQAAGRRSRKAEPAPKQEATADGGN